MSDRWEWRGFGERIEAAAARLSQSPADSVAESEELYVLSLRGDDPVKVRDDLLDVKHLVQVSAEGLEQWTPVLKAPFPVSAEDVRSTLGHLGVDAPPLARDAYTLDELLEEIVRPSRDLLVVEVRKRREHHTVDGCMAEVTELRADGGTTRTVAVESEDPTLVLAALRELGLRPRPNVNVPRGLGALVGFGARRFAVVDVGTNSVKLHLAERAADGMWRTLVDRAEVTRLGEGLDGTDRLQPEAMERTLAAIVAMADEARQAGADEIAAVGTAGLRAATNGAELVDAVRERCGIEIEVISGEAESRLAYLGTTSALDLPDAPVVVFDTGGGSSQFTFGHGDVVDERFSVPVGAVRFTERYRLDAAVSDETLAAALAAVGADLVRLEGRSTPEALVGMGGGVTNLAAVSHGLETYDAGIVQGTVLSLAEIDRQIELYRTHSAEERRQIVGLQPARAEVILAGACIVRTVVATLGRDSLVVSDRGLRHGVLIERFGR